MVVFSFFRLTPAVILVATTTTGITAWTEFQSTESKIHRYNSTTYTLQELVLWWSTRTSIEKSSVSNIDYLIESSEQAILLEVSTWKSTSQVQKLVDKQTGSDKKGGDTDEESH
jgi:hypothetical protein